MEGLVKKMALISSVCVQLVQQAKLVNRTPGMSAAIILVFMEGVLTESATMTAFVSLDSRARIVRLKIQDHLVELTMNSRMLMFDSRLQSVCRTGVRRRQEIISVMKSATHTIAIMMVVTVALV